MKHFDDFFFLRAPEGDSGSQGANDDSGDASEGDPGGEGDKGQTFSEDYVKKLREEAAKHRKEKQQLKEYKDKYEKVSQLFDGKDDPEKQLEETNKKLQDYEQKIASLRLTHTIQSEAGRLEADPDLTMAYLQSNGDLDGVEPDDSVTISEKIKAAMKAKPSLKVGKVTTTDTGGGNKSGRQSMNEWLAQRLSGPKQ